MRATVQRLHSPDVDVERYKADVEDAIEVLVQIIAGPEGSIGEESFDVLVCNPVTLIRLTSDRGPVLGRHLVIVSEWKWSVIRSFLIGTVEALEAETWPELATLIGRIGKWEFEDYVPQVADDEI
jgi:hypothetical protein